MAQQILLTKLFAPQLTEKHILREEAVKKLTLGYESNRQVTLVCAPAGYGKTTLVLEFLLAVKTSYAWISLDEGDNDSSRFLSYLTASLRSLRIPLGTDIDTLINDTGLSTAEPVLTLIINAVATHPEKIILVLDDLHLIRSAKIQEMIKFLIDHQPANLHFVMITREDPMFPLAGLRAKGRLTEIRMSDLLFTCSEAALLFHRTLNMKLSTAAVDKVTARTEGWIAGLKLAGLLLGNYSQEEAEAYLRNFDGSNTYIIDYLVEEVLTHQPEEIREFLIATSILERMNAPLCNELTGRTDSWDILQRIQRSNLFLICLDNRREWYRYHHLFADSLKINLAIEQEHELYKKAAKWMKKNGFSHEAVRYAFKSKDLELTLCIIEDSIEETFQNAQLDSLVKWLDQIPDDMIRSSEALCIRKAIAYFAVGRAQEAVQYLQTLDENFERIASRHNKGLLYSVRAIAAGAMGHDSEALAQKALEFLEPWDPIARTSTLNTLGRSQFRKGKLHDAAETFHMAFESGRKLGFQFVTTLALLNYSLCLNSMGRSLEALTLCRKYIDDMTRRYDQLPPFVGIIYLALAHILETLGEVETALKYHNEGSSLCRTISYDGEGSIKMYTDLTAAAQEEPKEEIPMAEQPRRTIPLEYGQGLTEREVEILGLITQGLSNQEIAKTLFISSNTAQWHISHIYAKLGVKSRTQAIIKAGELRIL